MAPRREFGIAIETIGGLETITYSDRPGQLGNNNPMGTSRRITRGELDQIVSGSSIAPRTRSTTIALPSPGGIPMQPTSSPYSPYMPTSFTPTPRAPTDSFPGGSSPYVDQSQIDVTGIAQQYGPAGCNLITNATARAACMAVIAVIGGSGGTAPGTTLANTTPSPTPGSACPDGYVQTSNGCARSGVVGTGQRWIPGGESGYVWEPALGMYGSAVTPFVRVTDTRRCPNGWVLGNDGMCYQRLDRRFRAHLPVRKPLLTANDGRILTKAKSLQKKLKRVSSKHVPRARTCSCGSGTTRKKK